jgi:peroxin-2
VPYLVYSYPSLLTRTLGLRLLPSQPILSRMVSYEFMNRQLVWGSLAVSYILLVVLVRHLY